MKPKDSDNESDSDYDCDGMACTTPIDLKSRHASLPDQDSPANESPKAREMLRMRNERLGGAENDEWSGMKGNNSTSRSFLT